jgi:hypothetical protein
MTAVVGFVCFVIGGAYGVFCTALAVAAKNRDRMFEDRD